MYRCIDSLIDRIYLNTVVLSEIKITTIPSSAVYLEAVLWITKYLQDLFGFLLIR